MNREQAKGLLPIIQAFVDGKTIQFKGDVDWIEVVNPVFHSETFYRIKPLEFPQLPDHLQWHNPDNLTPEQVGEGFRLICTAEADATKPLLKGIEYFIGSGWRKSAFQHGWEETYRVPSSTPFPEPQKPKVMVPLEPHDISPTDVLRQKDKKDFYAEHWMKINAVNFDGPAVHFSGSGRIRIPFKTLMNEWEISRDGAKTWKACEKESES